MRIAQIKIENFRGIAKAVLEFSGHTVLIGDNNSGKSSVLEAIDLVLGPDRLSAPAPIDEHDFYAGRYLDTGGNSVAIKIEAIVVDLSPEQIRRFKANLEFWNESTRRLVQGPPISAIESKGVKEALRVGFRGMSPMMTALKQKHSSAHLHRKSGCRRHSVALTSAVADSYC
jgi:putative ATP-dependent endonuclease of the OLD family